MVVALGVECMLETRSLSRVCGDITVVDNVNFTVTPGRITGFVGANGAGKTRMMRMPVGEVRWNGAPVTTGQRRRFGCMPEERGLYPRLNLVDQLVYFARLHGALRAEATDRARELLAHFDLEERAEDLRDKLSLGNQQRVQIAAALMHRPEALVFDEPFSGLDPLAVESMVELLAEQDSGIPVLFSSHQLDLVERLCDDLVILSGGRVAAAGSVDELRGQGPERCRVVLDQGDADWQRTVRGIAVRTTDGPSAVVDLDGATAPMLLAQIMAREPVREFAKLQQLLSEIFREAIQ